MAIALRSARFCGAFAVLEVRECADRSQIQIVVESGPQLATTRHVMTLTAEEWSQITGVPFIDDGRDDQELPENVLETFTLVDENVSLEVHERADRSSVLIVVTAADSDDDPATIELSADQWRYLQILDYTRVASGRGIPELHHIVELTQPSGSIH
jgi:hypothetical protein